MQTTNDTPKENKIVYSAIQPTNIVTIGNYLGAIKNWVALQYDYDCFYSVADLHSLTVYMEPATLRKNILDLYAMLLACGIDTNKVSFFKQSSVVEHSQLAWVLNCYTYFGEARRMTQFKEKSTNAFTGFIQQVGDVFNIKERNTSTVVGRDNVNVGLFAYPILQAADILLYNAGHVPIGADQKQHLELSRNLAERFNSRYSPTFVVPEVLIPKVAAKINSLDEPTKKMSKSNTNPNSMILLIDEDDVIVRKIKRAVTDSDGNIENSDKKPGISNLLKIYSAFMDCKVDNAVAEMQGKTYSQFKSILADVVVSKIRPIREKFVELRADKQYLQDCMDSGAEKAKLVASKTMNKVYRKIGIQ
ncbi:MAG: tryptophan--tRNA ligase [Firmicutes bacterium]|nr:tryptophan--tRNA ligase [Bacillota bacterium]MCL1953257.1 tryptophan--tRNA ligase [Bacillota bacterium]